jgi:hypothetical protein
MQPLSPSLVGAASPLNATLTSFPSSPRTTFTRTQRRRVSFGAALSPNSHSVTQHQSNASHSLRPDIFERLWSAHATSTSWTRSFVPSYRKALTQHERIAVAQAFTEMTVVTVHVSTDDVNEDGHGHYRVDDSTTQRDALLLANTNGANKLKHLLSTALHLTWLADSSEVISVMQATMEGRIASRLTTDEIEESVGDTAESSMERSLQKTLHRWFGGSLTASALCLDDVLVIAAAVKADSAGRRAVTLDCALGHAGGATDDPYTTTDEVAAAFVALGGSTDLVSAPAAYSTAAALLIDAGIDDNMLDEAGDDVPHHRSTPGGPDATGSSDDRSSQHRVSHRRRGSIGSDANSAQTTRTHTTSHHPAQHQPFRLGRASDKGFDSLGPAAVDARVAAIDDDEEDQPLPFSQFESIVAVDPWQSTAARLFKMLGGDPTDPRSRAPVEPMVSALRKMLRHEVSSDLADAYVDRFCTLHEGKSALTFDAFQATVILPLRRVCAGEIEGHGSSGGASSTAKHTAGSSGLLQMLSFVPNFGPKTLNSTQVLARLSQIIRESRKQRTRYLRLRGRVDAVFKSPCVMADTPHAHLAKLNRRHLLYVVNMVTQRRNFNLSVPKPAVEAVLRALTQAARLLRDHGRLCGHCNRFTEAITKPLPSETLPRTTASAAPAAPRPPVSADANFSTSTQGGEPLKRQPEPDSQRPMSPASSPSGAADLHSSANSKLAGTMAREPHAPATPIALQEVAGKQTAACSLNRSARLREEQRRREKVYAGKGISAKYVPTSAVPQPFAAGSRTASFPKAPAPPATARPFTATRPSRAGEEPSVISSSKSTETMFVRSLFVRQQQQRAAIAKQAEPADFRF